MSSLDLFPFITFTIPSIDHVQLYKHINNWLWSVEVSSYLNTWCRLLSRQTVKPVSMALEQQPTTFVGNRMHFAMLIKTSHSVQSTIAALTSDWDSQVTGIPKCRQTPTAAITHPCLCLTILTIWSSFTWPVQLIAFLGICNFAVCVCLPVFHYLNK